MKFTYRAYEELLINMKDAGYSFECFDNASEQYTVICRHDIDTSLEYALPIAEIESKLNISAIYFVLLSTSFYNVFSPANRTIINRLITLGHKVALHFDASVYTYENIEALQEFIFAEVNVLEILLQDSVNVISFHRPVKELFNIKLGDGLISAYEAKYFSGYTYISDSRRNWKENPYEILNKKPAHIQLLTHPIWYSDSDTFSARNAIERLKTSKDEVMMSALESNITEFNDFMGLDSKFDDKY